MVDKAQRALYNWAHSVVKSVWKVTLKREEEEKEEPKKREMREKDQRR